MKTLYFFTYTINNHDPYSSVHLVNSIIIISVSVLLLNRERKAMRHYEGVEGNNDSCLSLRTTIPTDG